MRVGFVNPVLWWRFGPPWAAMVQDLGVEVVVPSGDAVAAALDDARVAPVAALMPRLALASVVACGDCDVLVVPTLVRVEGGPGAAQDPWIADLPDMVAQALPGAGKVLAVPSEGGPEVASEVMTALTRVHRDAGLARRAWERQRSRLGAPARRVASAPRVYAPGGPRVAVVAHPWWLTPATLELAGAGVGTLVGQQLLDPGDARAEGRRLRPDLVDPDAEAIGAARRFGRQGDIEVVRLLLDPGGATSPWLERRVREAAGDKVEVVGLLELGGPQAWARALAGEAAR